MEILSGLEGFEMVTESGNGFAIYTISDLWLDPLFLIVPIRLAKVVEDRIDAGLYLYGLAWKLENGFVVSVRPLREDEV